MCALRRGKPDRLPVTIHQWQPYHLKHFMGGASDSEAFAACGLDASLTRSPVLEKSWEPWGDPTPEWRVEYVEEEVPANSAQPGAARHRIRRYTITTPGGVLTMVRRFTEITIWITEHLVKRDEDVDLVARHMPVPRYDRTVLRREYNALGDAGILRSYIPSFQPGPWQDAIEMHGMENMIMAALEKPDWVHHFVEAITQRRLRFIEESLKGAKLDLMEFGGGGASCTVISPAVFEEFVLPYDARVIRAIHDEGVPVVYHTCGGMMAILDLIPRNGCDASETLTPQSMGGDITDPSAVKRTLGAQVALIGGVDQEHVLKRGSEEDIRRHVRDLFGAYGEGGGYICSPSDHFFDVPVEKLKAYALAGIECCY